MIIKGVFVTKDSHHLLNKNKRCNEQRLGQESINKERKEKKWCN